MPPTTTDPATGTAPRVLTHRPNYHPPRRKETTTALLESPMSVAFMLQLRARQSSLEDTAEALTSLGYPVPDDVQWELDKLTGAHVQVQHTCMLCRGEFAVKWRLQDTGTPHEQGICGPCNARVAAQVVKA
jgi:hypothetical protein